MVQVKDKSVHDLKGMFTPPKGKHVTVEEMNPPYNGIPSVVRSKF